MAWKTVWVAVAFAVVFSACSGSPVTTTDRASTTPGCQTVPSVDGPGGGAAFVALATGDPDSVAVVLDSTGASVRGQIRMRGKVPEAALDSAGNQLVLACTDGRSWDLVSFGLASLRENWRQPLVDPTDTKAIGGLPALAVSGDGRYVFAMHSRALKADAMAPGGTRYWVSAHDARTGNPIREVEVPDCGGPGRLHADRNQSVYVLCPDAARVINTATWQITRSIPMPEFRPVSLSRDTKFYGVTADLRVVGVDIDARATIEDSKWSNTTAPIIGYFGRLALSPDGSRLWVLTRLSGDPQEWGPDNLTEIDLVARRRIDTPIRDIRGVGVVDGRLMYVAEGRLRSIDGATDIGLPHRSAVFWSILAAP